MTDNTYENESHHTPESRDRDARLVGHEVKADTSRDLLERKIRKLHALGATLDPVAQYYINITEALLVERDALEVENERWRDVAKWYDDTVEKHVTPTGKPARISDKNGVWHDGPAAEMAHQILRGLQDVLRAALKGDSHD